MRENRIPSKRFEIIDKDKSSFDKIVFKSEIEDLNILSNYTSSKNKDSLICFLVGVIVGMVSIYLLSYFFGILVDPRLDHIFK